MSLKIKIPSQAVLFGTFFRSRNIVLHELKSSENVFYNTVNAIFENIINYTKQRLSPEMWLTFGVQLGDLMHSISVGVDVPNEETGMLEKFTLEVNESNLRVVVLHALQPNMYQSTLNDLCHRENTLYFVVNNSECYYFSAYTEEVVTIENVRKGQYQLIQLFELSMQSMYDDQNY